MALLLSTLTNKDNLHIKTIQCISTFKKKEVNLNDQFKAVIVRSNANNLLKGQLVNALLVTSKKNRQWRSGKMKKFGLSNAICIKEANNFKPSPLGSRLNGLQTNNLKFVLERKNTTVNI